MHVARRPPSLPELRLLTLMTRKARPTRRLKLARRRRRRGGARRVLIILENEAVSQSHRVSKQINTLLEAGYRVAVVTRKHPGNRGYRDRPGVQLLEYPPPADAKGQVDYLAEYGYSFLAAAFLSFRAMLSERIDVVQFCQPPDVYFPLAWALKRLGVRILIDQRDLLPELYAARYGRVRPILLSTLQICEHLSHRSAQRIICTNEYQRNRAINESGLTPTSVSVIRNGPLLTHVDDAWNDESLKNGHRYLCCWVGVMGHQDRTDLLVLSVDYLVHELGRKDCGFVIIGYGECLVSTQALVRGLNLDEWVHFTGALPAKEVFQYLATADLGVDTGLQSDISPVKIFEYMAFGIPVVAFDLQETRALCEGAAVLAEPGDTKAHARAIDALLSNPQQHQELARVGQAKVREELAWDHQACIYVGVIEQLCCAKPRGSAVLLQ